MVQSVIDRYEAFRHTYNKRIQPVFLVCNDRLVGKNRAKATLESESDDYVPKRTCSFAGGKRCFLGSPVLNESIYHMEQAYRFQNYFLSGQYC